MNQRNLDGIYFRVKQNDKWESICFSDLTEDEADKVLKGRTHEYLKGICKALGRTLFAIGEQFNIKGRDVCQN